MSKAIIFSMNNLGVLAQNLAANITRFYPAPATFLIIFLGALNNSFGDYGTKSASELQL